MELLSDRIVIRRKGLANILTQGLQGDKTIPLSNITSVQFRASKSVAGVIQFTIKGGREFGGGLMEATKDENAVLFNSTQQPLFEIIRDKVISAISSPRFNSNAQLYNSYDPRTSKFCPQCAETVKVAAKMCRYCRYEFVESEFEPLEKGQALLSIDDLLPPQQDLIDDENVIEQDIIVSSVKNEYPRTADNNKELITNKSDFFVRNSGLFLALIIASFVIFILIVLNSIPNKKTESADVDKNSFNIGAARSPIREQTSDADSPKQKEARQSVFSRLAREQEIRQARASAIKSFLLPSEVLFGNVWVLNSDGSICGLVLTKRTSGTDIKPRAFLLYQGWIRGLIDSYDAGFYKYYGREACRDIIKDDPSGGNLFKSLQEQKYIGAR